MVLKCQRKSAYSIEKFQKEFEHKIWVTACIVVGRDDAIFDQNMDIDRTCIASTSVGKTQPSRWQYESLEKAVLDLAKAWKLSA